MSGTPLQQGTLISDTGIDAAPDEVKHIEARAPFAQRCTAVEGQVPKSRLHRDGFERGTIVDIQL